MKINHPAYILDLKDHSFCRLIQAKWNMHCALVSVKRDKYDLFCIATKTKLSYIKNFKKIVWPIIYLEGRFSDHQILDIVDPWFSPSPLPSLPPLTPTEFHLQNSNLFTIYSKFLEKTCYSWTKTYTVLYWNYVYQYFKYLHIYNYISKPGLI